MGEHRGPLSFEKLSDNIESASLLAQSVDYDSVKPSLKRTFCVFYIILLHVVSLAVLLGSAFQNPSCPSDSHNGGDKIYSPAIDAVQLVTESRPDYHSHTPFAGPPNERNTRAWESLLIAGFFNASKEEVQFMGASTDESVRVIDGGYLASFHVYHEIHCLRRLRLWLYRETYYPHISPDSVIDIQRHLDHCIESLRRNTMCRADIGVDTFVWTHPEAQKPTMRSTGLRKCVDWKRFENWAIERRISMHPSVIRPTD